MEECRDVVRVGSGEHNLGSAAFPVHIDDDGLDVVAAAVVFLGNLLISGQNGFGSVKIDDEAALFPALHGTGDDFANAFLVVVVDIGLFGIAQALDDDLLRGLGGNAAEILNLDAEAHFVVDLDTLVELPGFGELYFPVGIVELIVRNDDLELVDLNVAGLPVVAHLDAHVLGVAALYGCAHCVLKSLHKKIRVNRLVLADLINGFFQFLVHSLSARGFCMQKRKRRLLA